MGYLEEDLEKLKVSIWIKQLKNSIRIQKIALIKELDAM